MSGVVDWTPIHHEDMDQEQEPPAHAKKKTEAALKKDRADDDHGPALVLTIPPTFAAAMWSLSEALRENTEALREHTKEMRATRGE